MFFDSHEFPMIPLHIPSKTKPIYNIHPHSIMSTQSTQSTQMLNFPNNPLRKYKRLGDLLVPDPINRGLSTYILGNDQTQIYISLWSVNHLLSGIMVGYMLRYHTEIRTQEKRYMTGIIIHTLWEFFQIAVENTELTNLRGQIDVVMDTVLFMLGMMLVEEIDVKDS